MPRADYEGRVLRTALLHPNQTLPVLTHSLTVDDFTSNLYRSVFEIITDLVKERGKVSTPAITDALKERRIPVSILLDVWDSTYSQDELDEPIKEIRSRTQLQEMQKVFTQARDASNRVNTKPDELVTHVMNRLHELRAAEKKSDVSNVRDRLNQQWEKMNKVDSYQIKTGFGSIDFVTYGMRPQNLWLVGGYTSVGKSWIGCQMVNQHLLQKVPTLWVSYEMSAEELLWRLAIQRLNRPDITLHGVKRRELSKDKIDEFLKVLDELEKEPLYIVDYLSDWERSKLEILYHIYAHGVKCVVVDYVQNIITSSASEYEGLNRIIRDLQHISVEREVFVAAFSQMSRQSVRDGEDYVFGFKGSGNLENAADVALVLKHGDPKNRKDPRRVLEMGKNRSGMLAEAYLITNYAYGNIANVEQEVWENYQPSSDS